MIQIICLSMLYHEENHAASIGNMRGEVEGVEEKFSCLLKVKDINTLTSSKEVWGHIGVPEQRPMAKVGAEFKESFS